jgi:hypothetical protein
MTLDRDGVRSKVLLDLSQLRNGIWRASLGKRTTIPILGG